MIITSASDRTLKHEFYGKLAISPPMFKNFLGHLRTHYPAEFSLISLFSDTGKFPLLCGLQNWLLQL